MDDIKSILMERDNMTSAEADALIKEAQIEMDNLLAEGNLNAAERICEDWFGLEPDYIMELI